MTAAVPNIGRSERGIRKFVESFELMVRPATWLLLLLICFATACGLDWQDYRSNDGRFEIRFPPGSVRSHETSEGDRTIRSISVAVSHDTFSYGVSWFDLPNADERFPAELLKEREGRLKRMVDATSSESRETKLGDVPGRAFSMHYRGGPYFYVRLYAKGAKPVRIYQLTAGSHPAMESGDVSRVERFFDSFKLID